MGTGQPKTPHGTPVSITSYSYFRHNEEVPTSSFAVLFIFNTMRASTTLVVNILYIIMYIIQYIRAVSCGFLKTRSPYPSKPVSVITGTGFDGYGYGLPWKTPGFGGRSGSGGTIACRFGVHVAEAAGLWIEPPSCGKHFRHHVNFNTPG